MTSCFVCDASSKETILIKFKKTGRWICGPCNASLLRKEEQEKKARKAQGATA